MAHLPLTEEWQGEKGDSVTSSESYSYPCARGLYAPPGWGNGSHQSRFVERGERLNGRKVPDGWLRAANRLRHSERRAIAVWVRGLVAFFRSSLLVVHTAERGALLDRVRPEAIIAKIAVRHCRLGVLENGDRELRVTLGIGHFLPPASHSSTWRTGSAAASRLPSGLKATHCPPPVNSSSSRPPSTSQSRIVASAAPAVARR